jgi:hypothetical protein
MDENVAATDVPRVHSSAFLAEMRGKQVQFQMQSLPPTPPAVEAIVDPSLKQHAKDAWAAASRLKAAIGFWTLFLHAQDLGLSIDADNQQAITAIFPELKDVQTILDHLAALPRDGRPALDVPGGRPFPAQEFFDLIQAAHGLIRKNARALAAIGICSPSFSSPTEPAWEHFASVFEEPVNFTQVPPKVRLKPRVQPELLQLQREAHRFLELLATAPAAALMLAKHSPASPPASHPEAWPLSADVAGGTITLKGTVYQVTPAKAAFVNALIKAKGNWRSGRELAEGEPELEGVRLDRLRKALPEPARALIQCKPGRGFRLNVESLT